jgi:cell division protein FtsB
VSDTTSTDQSPVYHGGAEPPLPQLPYRRRWPKRVGIAVLAVVALLAGVGIGGAANSNAGALASARSANASLRGQVSTLHSQVGTLQGQLTTAQAQARNAVAAAASAANAKAAVAYATRNAALSQQAATLKQQQATLAQQQQAVKAQMGELQASQISGDGVYVVGKDIKAGVYHTNGSGNTGANDCYFATLNSTDTSNIANNNNFDGPETVDVSSAYAFDVNGPCTWVKVG